MHQSGEPGGSPIEQLVGFDGPIDVFLARLLETLCGEGGGAQAAILNTPASGAAGWIACHPRDVKQHSDSGAWLERAQQWVGARPLNDASLLPLHNSTGQQVWAQIAACPLRDPVTGVQRGCLFLFLASPDPMKGQQALLFLERSAQVIARFEQSRALRQKEKDLVAVSHAVQSLDAINRESRCKPAAIALCNQASDAWKASRVSVGFLAGENIKLLAMSHTEDVSRKMQLVQDLEAAMEECVDQDSEILVPSPENATTINRQARVYVDKHGPARLCVLPLRLHGEVVGALSVEWPTDYTITHDDVESLRLAANLWTARLHQFHLDDRWLGARMAASIRKGAGVMVGPKHTWAKLLAIAIVAFLAFAFFVKGDDTVDGSFTVQTTERQVISAPFEGTLLSVGEGSEVNEPVIGTDDAGAEQQATVLAVMDTSELRVERAAIEAQIADFRAQANTARGEGDLAAVEIAEANVRRLEAQAALYDYRIARSTLISPMSGVIIEGDLRQRINGMLEKGEVLFEIAPIDALRAEILVPASRIGSVRSRLTHPDNPSKGELASASHPGDFIGFTVERIEPEAEVVNGENVFRVRVSLDKKTQWLRPGVEGEARVHVERRSYAYLWTRDAVNWVRMKLWM